MSFTIKRLYRDYNTSDFYFYCETNDFRIIINVYIIVDKNSKNINYAAHNIIIQQLLFHFFKDLKLSQQNSLLIKSFGHRQYFYSFNRPTKKPGSFRKLQTRIRSVASFRPRLSAPAPGSRPQKGGLPPSNS